MNSNRYCVTKKITNEQIQIIIRFGQRETINTSSKTEDSPNTTRIISLEYTFIAFLEKKSVSKIYIKLSKQQNDQEGIW